MLVQQGLVDGLDGVHGGLGAGELAGEIVDADGAANFEETGRDAETVAYEIVSTILQWLNQEAHLEDGLGGGQPCPRSSL